VNAKLVVAGVVLAVAGVWAVVQAKASASTNIVTCSYGVVARYGPALPDTTVTLLIVLTESTMSDSMHVPTFPAVLLCSRMPSP